MPNLCLQEKATKWYSDGEIDGLTTNGVLIMHPIDGFAGNSKPGIWREVSVDGGIYALRESRSTPQKSSLVRLVFCIIGLSCDVHYLFLWWLSTGSDLCIICLNLGQDTAMSVLPKHF